jgi:hypothetical protein
VGKKEKDEAIPTKTDTMGTKKKISTCAGERISVDKYVVRTITTEARQRSSD